MQQKLFQNCFTARSWSFGNNKEKEQQKPRPKLKNYVYYTFTDTICFACSLIQVVLFSKNVLTL